ncbi:MAG: 16S rRNA (cytosine(1402)-N(4))-methyltransferase RsmH [Bacillota bacterium]
MDGFDHITVLLKETVDAVKPEAGGTYVDCTLGGAGHTRLLLERLGGVGMVVGIDQDQRAISNAQATLSDFADQLVLVRRNFSSLDKTLTELGIAAVQGVLFDLGVSSPQLDEGERGFSYRFDAPLDMRMDQSNPLTAWDLVNHASEEELAQIIWDYGEERWAKRIAQFVIASRQEAPIDTTGQLVDIIKRAIPAKARENGPHPAKRTFQAIRIKVNDELGVLERALEKAIGVLAPGGRLAVISFHSLEDRIVKQVMARHVNPCTCPPRIPVCICGKRPDLRIITRKPILPSDEEIALNPRSRSAKLRVGEKLACSSH